MKKYNFGEIYFIRENEFLTGRLSPFVKIGLVRYSEKRDSFGRMAEHQTGNPRRLSLESSRVVKTEAVDMVEARLHQRYAKSRISGEWFEFSDEATLEEAIHAAEAMSQEVAEIVPKFHIADELDRLESKGKRSATKSDMLLVERLVRARSQRKECEALEKEVKEILTKAVSEGSDISIAAKNSVTNYSPTFLEEQFKNENKDLWEDFLQEVQTWSHTFLPKIKVEDLGDEFSTQILGIKTSIDAVRNGAPLSDLVEVTLSLTNLKGVASWEEKVAETELKIEVGQLEEIEGVCTWKRHWNKTQKFNSAAFAGVHPELAKKYVSTPEPKAFVKPKKGKA
jgi:hypothetical protein